MPGKRPYHTIIPGMMTREDGSLYGTFGVMGGFMQPQGHMQVAVNLLDDGMDPQSALDLPRWCIEPNRGQAPQPGSDCLEEGIPAETLAALQTWDMPSARRRVGTQPVWAGKSSCGMKQAAFCAAAAIAGGWVCAANNPNQLSDL